MMLLKIYWMTTLLRVTHTTDTAIIFIFKQMSQFFESTLFNHQCGFRKGLNTQQCLLVLVEKWKRSVDRVRLLMSC